MSSPDSFASASDPKTARLSALIERVQAFRSSVIRTYWRVYLIALLYGAIAWLQGSKFFILYCGVLVTVFELDRVSVRRGERQIDSVLDTLRDLHNDK